MRAFNVRYAHHAETQDGEVDRIAFALDGTSPKPTVPFLLVNRGAGELYFDWTYPDGAPPVETIEPGQADTYVVVSGSSILLDKPHMIDAFTVVAASVVPYSVMALY